jgi:hypothetical protein
MQTYYYIPSDASDGSGPFLIYYCTDLLLLSQISLRVKNTRPRASEPDPVTQRRASGSDKGKRRTQTSNLPTVTPPPTKNELEISFQVGYQGFIA